MGRRRTRRCHTGRDTRDETTRQTGPARDAGSPRDAGGAADSVQARDARPGLDGDFGPDPLGAPGGRGATADFLAAQPAGSILTTTPRQNTRTARPAVATETIAAELAGWAAGELPGQASARLAAWAAIGGVPAPGNLADSTDVGAAGVGTERVR